MFIDIHILGIKLHYIRQEHILGFPLALPLYISLYISLSLYLSDYTTVWANEYKKKKIYISMLSMHACTFDMGHNSYYKARICNIYNNNNNTEELINKSLKPPGIFYTISLCKFYFSLVYIIIHNVKYINMCVPCTVVVVGHPWDGAMRSPNMFAATFFCTFLVYVIYIVVCCEHARALAAYIHAYASML